jgi:hypothetical protein
MLRTCRREDLDSGGNYSCPFWQREVIRSVVKGAVPKLRLNRWHQTETARHLDKLTPGPRAQFLVANIPLDGPEINEASSPHAGIICCVVRSYHVHVNVGPVCRPEVGETKNTISVPSLVNSRSAVCGMRNAMEHPGSDRFQRGTAFGSRHSCTSAVLSRWRVSWEWCSSWSPCRCC